MGNFVEPSDHRALAGRRVLVLGASGFLGRWVARLLTRSGADVHASVRDPERSAAIFDRWGVRATVHAVDLSQEAEVSRMFARVEPAVTFNLVGYGVGREERAEHPSTILNARLPEWLAGSLRPGMDLVHVGSALEYGAAGGDLRESTACRPTTLYGRTKLEGTLAVARVAALRTVTARVFTVYGAGERSGRLLPSLVDAAAGSGEIALGPGTQRRDFLYVEDAAEGLIRLACAPGRSGEIVNLATGKLTSVREFALAAARLLGVDEERLRFGALPMRPDEMNHEPVRIDRLREWLGWSPPADLEAGLARALAWRRET